MTFSGTIFPWVSTRIVKSFPSCVAKLELSRTNWKGAGGKNTELK